MAHSSSRDNFYVAPDDAPPPRRPPASEVGWIHWLRENLFRSTADTIITFVTLAVLLFFLYTVLSWAFLKAQWEVVFLNLRALGVGILFPSAQVWRAELAGLIVIFLSLLSVGVWGRVNRAFQIAIACAAAVMIVVPFVSRVVPEPPVYLYVDATYDIRQVNFIAQQGQEIGFTIQPLTNTRDFNLSRYNGYIENDNQAANTAFDAFNSTTAAVNSGQLDPAQYDLNLAVQIWDTTGAVVAESAFTQGADTELEFHWEAPSSGWFTFTLIRDEENPGSAGVAWLRVDNLEIYRSTIPETRARTERYGDQPPLDCRGCATEANRTDMRYQGTRTLPQWFSLQLTPFLLETRLFFFKALVLGAVAYLIGKNSSVLKIPYSEPLRTAERLLLIIAASWLIGYVGVQIMNLLNPQPILMTLRSVTLAAFIFSVFLYAIALYARGAPDSVTRAVTLLWILSIPTVLVILSGFTATPNAANPPLPRVNSTDYGGLLLTLLLSAVAIVSSFPIGLALALGRQSSLPVISFLCTVVIEVVRGVPLITLLFMGRLILPFFGFGLGSVDLLIRISVVLTIFTSAYLAEIIRGGLQIVPKGQLEAAHALGLNDFWTTIHIVLPQALRAVIPAIMGQAVSLFKDTSLVYVASLFEILGTMNQILGDSQTGYIAFPREGTLYVAIIFFVFSFIMADVSRRLERSGSGAVRRETL